MSLQKFGITVRCEECVCIDREPGASFEVEVPVTAGGRSGNARLHCEVARGVHQVKLVDWQDANHQPLPPDDLPAVNALVDFVARQGLCGKTRLCPAEVVRIVEDDCGA